jgi:hypothetical protein
VGEGFRCTRLDYLSWLVGGISTYRSLSAPLPWTFRTRNSDPESESYRNSGIALGVGTDDSDSNLFLGQLLTSCHSGISAIAAIRLRAHGRSALETEVHLVVLAQA